MLNGFTIKGNNSLLVINLYASSNCGHCEVSLCFEKKTKTRMKKKVLCQWDLKSCQPLILVQEFLELKYRREKCDGI